MERRGHGVRRRGALALVVLVGLAAACGRGALVEQRGASGTTGTTGTTGTSGTSATAPGSVPPTIPVPPVTTADPSAPITTFTFYVEGPDADVDVALGLLRGRIETTGLGVKSLDAGGVLANGSGKRPVTLTVRTTSSMDELEWLVQQLARPGVPDLAGVLSSRRVGSHYPLDCRLGFAAGAVCFLLDGSVGRDDLIGRASVAGLAVSVSWRDPHVVDALRGACVAHEPVCPSGAVALTIDGTVVGQAAFDRADLDPAGLTVSLPDGDVRQLPVHAAILASGPLPLRFRVTFSPDPAPSPPGCPSCGDDGTPTTASPPPGGAIPTTAPASPTTPLPVDPNSTTTAPGPGATARFCPDPSGRHDPSTSSTTSAPDC